MGLLFDETFYVQVLVGARWEWLRSFPPGDPARGRVVSVPDTPMGRRIRLALKAPVFAQYAVARWARCEGMPEGARVVYRVVGDSWRGVRTLPEDEIVIPAEGKRLELHR